jgi:hypothetical protein
MKIRQQLTTIFQNIKLINKLKGKRDFEKTYGKIS